LQHPHGGAGHAGEEGGALHQPLGQPLGVAAHQEEVALQVHKLVDPERIERWSLRRDRGGQLIFLLPHGGGGCRPPSRRASIRTVNRTGGRMSVDIRRETEELVRYYGELVRRLSQSGVRDVADLLGLYERLGRALETVSRQEIGWVTEQVQRLIEALVLMDSNLDPLRRLKKAASPPPARGSLEPGGWWVEPIRDLGVPVEEIPRRGPADVRRLARLRVALRRFAPHVVHTILWSGNSYGRLAALGLGIPVVIAAERVVPAYRAWQVMVERALDRVTDAYLVNCEAIAAWQVERKRLPREKIEVIPNGIDLGRLPPFSLDRR